MSSEVSEIASAPIPAYRDQAKETASQALLPDQMRLKNRNEIIAWGMFDLANQSFALLVNTLLFALFFKEAVLAGARFGDFAWSLMGALGLAAVVVVGPVLGAVADARAMKKRFLIVTGALCAILTCGLALIPSGEVVGVSVALTVTVLLYVPANFAFNVGENFLGAFLPEISDRSNMGLVSAIGATMGLLGALALLLIVAGAAAALGMEDPRSFRPLLLFAGVWFGVMMLPTIWFLKERAVPQPLRPGASMVREAFARLGRTIREAAMFRDFAALLCAVLIFGMGMQVNIFFAGVIARDDFGFSTAKLVSFSAVVTVTAAIGAALTGAFQDRFGHKPTLLVYLALWTMTSAGLAYLASVRESSAHPSTLPVWPIWLVGNGIGIGLGGLGTATRAAVGVLTPVQRTAEFFNLWGCTYKLAGVAGLPLFGAVRSVYGSVQSLVVLAAFFVVGGLIVLTRLNLPRGIAAAEAAEFEST